MLTTYKQPLLFPKSLQAQIQEFVGEYKKTIREVSN